MKDKIIFDKEETTNSSSLGLSFKNSDIGSANSGYDLKLIADSLEKLQIGHKRIAHVVEAINTTSINMLLDIDSLLNRSKNNNKHLEKLDTLEESILSLQENINSFWGAKIKEEGNQEIDIVLKQLEHEKEMRKLYENELTKYEEGLGTLKKLELTIQERSIELTKINTDYDLCKKLLKERYEEYKSLQEEYFTLHEKINALINQDLSSITGDLTLTNSIIMRNGNTANCNNENISQTFREIDDRIFQLIQETHQLNVKPKQHNNNRRIVSFDQLDLDWKASDSASSDNEI
ncbi:hypothetical protein Kpol_1018p59 [Vanderwaltozyma polyspora DSM 70294]|uniref:Uncharacterized protein n=1 Tax=Vanderwaltozyma polyspora (strain ATCC 22028 / DSM 70294 / BCRC 21397 / CBS 2163 / NBRC 10782 / NRRL Y-8283 / UCD 57-17) TaxID=436907 RepID=A7TDQ7_VANPO|nr:uncharacterized protein Kpol_1018p59 [Vanderwaltozyma polyspora DSM 70294]EDO19527.1 hypothetical protein Kpol_1018p59 [Vanderwaltozyma polyspora DSM 70294]